MIHISSWGSDNKPFLSHQRKLGEPNWHRKFNSAELNFSDLMRDWYLKVWLRRVELSIIKAYVADGCCICDALRSKVTSFLFLLLFLFCFCSVSVFCSSPLMGRCLLHLRSSCGMSLDAFCICGLLAFLRLFPFLLLSALRTDCESSAGSERLGNKVFICVLLLVFVGFPCLNHSQLSFRKGRWSRFTETLF